MKKKRSVWSLLFVFAWVGLFVFGIYLVYLFLSGYSFFDARILQKGYASFYSDSSLFLNGEYLGKGRQYRQFEVGSYDLCAEEFGKRKRCYDDVKVGTNEEVSQDLKVLRLLPEDENSLIFPVAKKEDIVVFSDDFSAVVWYDVSLKQLFYVDVSGDEVESFFPSFEVVGIEFDENLRKFVCKGFFEEKEEHFEIGVNTGFHFLDIESVDGYVFGDRFFFKVLSGGGVFEDEEFELKGVYSSLLEKSYLLNDELWVLFFKNAIYLFSEERNVFVFLSLKDEKDIGICVNKMDRCYFMRGGELHALQL